MIWGFAILFTSYFICMVAFILGFKKTKVFSSERILSKTRFSVIIPFRNEAENLPSLLKTIAKLNYPFELFEIIFVNDTSEDNSEAIIAAAIEKSKFSIKLIQNKRVSNSPKKDAIQEAIKNSNFEWIITTDADCELPKNWLNVFDSYIQQNDSIMVCGPVIYKSNGSFIDNFQKLDGFSLQSITIGSFGLNIPLLNNGANLAYRKDAFLKVNGFSGNDHIASGDDIFLLEKMKKHFPDRVHFLKTPDVIVSTKPQPSWRNVINQRIRWASKTSKQKNTTSILLGILVFLVNFSVLIIPAFMVFDFENILFYTSLFFFKIITDYLVVRQTALFFDEKIAFWKFLWQPFVYSFIVLAVVLGSFGGNYSWKGRTYEKQ
ncbi:glycosyltransferase family 2 protein [Aequorivita nionensis]|uniref:glycosyltransferase family 2 protein n=1 Tax=Aequorivita nionensis TaxID=1287690 RepID=UPI003965CAB2